MPTLGVIWAFSLVSGVQPDRMCRQRPLPREQWARGDARGCELAYKMVAERDNEKYSFARESRLLIVAKARVWASEGWRVVITDQDGKAYAPTEFDQLLAA